MIKRKNGKKKGFSLIELIIVLAVMAIIALIAIPNFTAVRENSKKKADERSAEVIERAVLMLVSDDSVNVKEETEIVFTVPAVTTPETPAKDDNTGNGLTAEEISLINDALAKVNPPQQENKTKYIFKISVDGKVTVPKIE